MTRIRLPGIHRVKKRHADGLVVEYHMIRGKPRSTFWRSDSEVAKGSPDYLRAYAEAKKPGSMTAAHLSTGRTFGNEVIEPYLESPAFRKLAPRTRQDYQKWLDCIRDKWARAPLAVFEDPRIRQQALAWRNQWDGRQADYAWTVLCRLVRWARDQQKVLQHHHLLGVERVYQSDRSGIIWTEEEVATVEAGAPDYIWKALRAAVETGLRPGDLCLLSKGHVKPTDRGRRIQIRTAKRKRMASIPVTQKMAAIVDAAPGMVILTDRDGKPWEPKRLAHAVTYWRDRLDLRKELHFYDARGSACTRLILAGASLGEIAAVMGWGTKTAASMIEVYATLDPRLADSVLVKLEQVRAAGS